MKKVTFILALGVTLTLAACGSGSTANQTTDSTSVSTDSTTSGAPVNATEVETDEKKPISNQEVK